MTDKPGQHSAIAESLVVYKQIRNEAGQNLLNIIIIKYVFMKIADYSYNSCNNLPKNIANEVEIADTFKNWRSDFTFPISYLWENQKKVKPV